MFEKSWVIINMSKTAEILKKYRQEIDEIDEKLMDLLGRRFEIVNEVGNVKAQHSIEVVQSKRADEVVERAMRMAEERGVNPFFIRSFYESMIDEAHIIEHAIADEHDKSE